MKKVIPFIAHYHAEKKQNWLNHLNQALPEHNVLPAEEINAEQRKACDIAIIANASPEEIMAFENLKWVHSIWAGVEKIVGKLPLHIQIVRLVDPNLSEEMAEAVLTWCLYIKRNISMYAAQQQKLNWQPHPPISKNQCRVGILGLGALGQACAQRLSLNGFIVNGWSRSKKTISGVSTCSGSDGLNDTLKGSDILVCLLPLTPSTRSLLNSDRLSLLPQKASVINFARGPILDTKALISALDSGLLNHAVLDVFDQEPLPASSPLWQHPNITVLPHVAASTSPESASEIVANNIRHYELTGELVDRAEIERGY